MRLRANISAILYTATRVWDLAWLVSIQLLPRLRTHIGYVLGYDDCGLGQNCKSLSSLDELAPSNGYPHPQGPALFYVDSDGSRLKGDLFSVGSGSTFAYGVLDQGYRWDLTDEEAQELGRRSIYAAGHRDAFSGNTCNLYHVKEAGWEFIGACSILLWCLFWRSLEPPTQSFGAYMHAYCTMLTIHPVNIGNYDITKMHYDGPGQVPGAPGGGYGYDVRTEVAPAA